jgi:hypothetical protein
MSFDAFAELFGTKGDFVRSIPKNEQSAFERAATRVHKAGFDWYIADNNLCFGVKPVDNSRASPRAGRVWDSFKVTINFGRKQFAVMSSEMTEHMESCGGTLDTSGTRFRFSIAQYEALVSDEAFLDKLADLCGVTEPTGLWPEERREAPELQHEVTSIQEVFRGTNAALAVVQRLDWSRTNRKALEQGFTWHWPRLGLKPDLVVLHFKDDERREIWAGRYKETKPARDGDPRFELHVEKFELVGVHFPADVNETDLYGGEAGGGSRIYVRNEELEDEEDGGIPPDVEKKAWVQIRQHQAKFKKLLMKEWGSRCAISGCDVKSVLEGAHIIPYSTVRDYSKWNGLLLRADIHRLFDAFLLSVDADGRVHVASEVEDPLYTALDGRKVTFPKKKWLSKLTAMLAERHEGYLER